MNEPGHDFNAVARLASQYVCRYRRAWWCRMAGHAAFYFWRAYENRNFDMATNGEEWILRKVATLRPQCVFDIGAHRGDWSMLYRSRIPEAEIHAFEISSCNYTDLCSRTASLARIRLNRCGMAEHEGTVTVAHASGASYRNSIFQDYFNGQFDSQSAERFTTEL